MHNTNGFKMNKIIAALAAVVVIAVSCKKEEKPKVTVEPASAIMENVGGTTTLVLSSNAPWTASCDYEDVSVNPSSGNGGASVVITVPKSTYRETKAIRVTFSAKRDSSYTSTAKFVITLPATPFVDLSSDSAYVSPDGGGIRFNLYSNCAWTAVADNTVQGLAISPAQGEGNADVTISIPANTTGLPRSSIVTFTLDSEPDVKAAFTVRQNQQ